MVPPLRALLALPLLAAGSVAASARSRHASWDDARAPPSDEHYDPFLGMEQRRGLDGRPGTSMSMSMSMPRDREEEEGPGSPGGPGLSAAAVAVAVAGGDAEDCACAAPEGGEPPSSGDSCPILLLLPFTARGRPLRELPPGLGFSHMAAALLAIDHFNARDPSVVPDLPDLVPDCDVELPIRLPNGRSIAADVGDHVDPAVRAVLDSLGGDGTQDDGEGGACAAVGPFLNKAAGASAITTGALRIPLISYGAADAKGLGRSHELPMTAKIVADNQERAAAVVDWLFDGRGRDYVHLVYMYDLTDVAEAVTEAVAAHPRSDDLKFKAVTVRPPNLVESMKAVLGDILKSTWKTIVVALSRTRQWDQLVLAADALGMLDPSLNLVWVAYDSGVDVGVLAANTGSRERARLLHGMGFVRVLDGFQARPDEDRFLRSWRGKAGNASFVGRLNGMHPIKLPEKENGGGEGGSGGGSKGSGGGGNGGGSRGNGNGNGGQGQIGSSGNAGGARNATHQQSVHKGSEGRGGAIGQRALQKGGGGGKGGGGKGGSSTVPTGYYKAAPDYFATHDPEPYSAFVYDAVVALGIGRCRRFTKLKAGLEEIELPPWNPRDGPPTWPLTGTGDLFYNETVNVTFQGATGEVVLHDQNFFSRNGRTMAYGVYNIRAVGGNTRLDEDPPANATTPEVYKMEHVLTSVREPYDDEWTPVLDDGGAPLLFLHADGTAAEPAPLHEISPNNNAGIIAAIALGTVLGALLAGGALYAAWKRFMSYRQISRAHEKRMQTTLDEADLALQQLDYPLHLLRGDKFVDEGALVRHEILRDQHKLTVIDHLGDVDAFIAAGNHVVFFSHQWTSYKFPDPTMGQYRSMVTALKGLARALGWHPALQNVWVWVDYGCIPQACPSTQSLAIRSLAAYASSATYFIVCAPDVTHSDTRETCTLSTYQKRMWCRAEQVCYSMRNGTSKMYLATHNTGSSTRDMKAAKPPVVIVPADFFRESLRVFSGELTCCRLGHPNGQKCDRLSLVVPILGLYGELYRASLVFAASGMKEDQQSASVAEFLSEIEKHQEDIFPRTFQMVTTRKGRKTEEEVILFGDLIERIRARVESGTRCAITTGKEATLDSSMNFSRHNSLDSSTGFIRHGFVHGSSEARRGSLRDSLRGSLRGSLRLERIESANLGKSVSKLESPHGSSHSLKPFGSAHMEGASSD